MAYAFSAIRAVQKVNPHRTMDNLPMRALKTSEEVGELARAALSVTHPRNPRGITHDEMREEGVDTAMMGLCCALTPKRGETPEEAERDVIAIMQRKLRKWEMQINNGRDLTIGRV